ncbi:MULTISPECIES: CvpA family protein [Galbibacter]|uniref:CvpA family protein n=1 Tax=Galbibacter pacificus TaxID=2996052 RepID=A0ABT6FTQ2_9FLAO|nr:CvpA family protein [Galbibacter pacificus]MDG3583171.1 CvpA family protein [Galbibacter pacificus]MDG3586652.1 CvpA family protein [Galbibacter pacificus]
MNYIDIVLGGLILFGLVRGFMKGLFIEVASLVALILGIYGAINFSYFIGDYLQDKVTWDQKYISLTAFALTFIGIIIIVSLLGKLLTKIANLVALGILNRILGALFGGLKIAVILGAVLIFIHKSNQTVQFIDQETIDSSVVYQPVKQLGDFVFNWVLRDA